MQKITVRLIGTLKGIANKEYIEIGINKDEIEVRELLQLLVKFTNNEVNKRIFNEDESIMPDILINYEDKIFPACLNENYSIKANSTVTVFTFVHGG